MARTDWGLLVDYDPDAERAVWVAADRKSLQLMTLGSARSARRYEPPLKKRCLCEARLAGELVVAQVCECDGWIPEGAWLTGPGGAWTREFPERMGKFLPLRSGDLWVVPTEVPHRVYFLDQQGKTRWLARLPALDLPGRKPCEGCLALAHDPFGMLVSQVNPAALLPDGRVAVLSSRAIAVVDPRKKKIRSYPLICR